MSKCILNLFSSVYIENYINGECFFMTLLNLNYKCYASMYIEYSIAVLLECSITQLNILLI